MGKKKPAAARQESRWFDLPYSAVAPRVVNPELGLHGLVRRRERCYTMQVTLLDAPDGRLLRAGVVLAHRVVDERGEWYLDAPPWAPWLPRERVEQMGDAELPQALADLVLPFRRWATLGPVAALTCEREEFVLRGPQRRNLALIREDKVTASRSGVTFARYREVTIEPLGLTRPQWVWLTESLEASGATRLSALPTLFQRLGSNPGPYGAGEGPETWSAETDLETFVSGLLGLRHHQLLGADLRVRAGGLDDPAGLVETLGSLQRELHGLAPALEPAWLADIDDELTALIAQVTRAPAATLRSERYLRLLDELVQASRSPRVGSLGQAPALATVRSALENAVSALGKTGRRLGLQASERVWASAAAAGEATLDAAAVAALLDPVWGKRVHRRAVRLVSGLGAAVDPEVEALAARYPAGTPAEGAIAFADGRRYENLLRARNEARREVLARWPARMAKLAEAVRR